MKFQEKDSKCSAKHQSEKVLDHWTLVFIVEWISQVQAPRAKVINGIVQVIMSRMFCEINSWRKNI